MRTLKSYFMVMLIACVSATSFVSCSEDNESSDATIKSIAVSKGQLTPTFSTEVASYTLDIAMETSVSITPLSNDTNASYTISGTTADDKDVEVENNVISNLAIGNNTVKINVVAENGSTKIYTIKVVCHKYEEYPNTPAEENLVAYINFNGEVADDTENQTIALGDIAFGTDRKGAENKAGSFDGAGQIVEIAANDGLFNKSMTISYWMKIDELTDPTRFHFGLGGPNGFFLEAGTFTPEGGERVGYIKFVTNHVNEGTNPGEYGNAWSEYKGEREGNEKDIISGVVEPIIAKIENKWVQLAYSFDAATSVKTFYIDGVKVSEQKINYTEEETPEWNLTELAIKSEDGMSENFVIGAGNAKASTTPWLLYNPDTTFKGLMDDFRIYDAALSSEQMSALYDIEK